MLKYQIKNARTGRVIHNDIETLDEAVSVQQRSHRHFKRFGLQSISTRIETIDTSEADYWNERQPKTLQEARFKS